MNDALLIEKLAFELDTLLSGGRIDKINMPEHDEIILGIRANGNNYKLLISAAAHSPRIHLTESRKENPAIAPSFLMHLRKHIGGGVISEIESVKYERVIKIKIIHNNELLIPETTSLIAEIMGKHSNIILVGGDNIISDSIKHIGLDVSGKRQVLPSLKYMPPPPQDKLAPSDILGLTQLLTAFTGGKIDSYLSANMYGLAPATVTEAVIRALGTVSAPSLTPAGITKIINSVNGLYGIPAAPCIVKNNGVPVDFLPFRFVSINAEYADAATISEAIDICMSEKDKAARFQEKARALTSLLKNKINKDVKKLAALTEIQHDAAGNDKYRIYGELVISNIYKIKKGDRDIVTENFYDNNNMIKIPLDENMSPQQNAQKFFNRYSKSKRALEHALIQLDIINSELDYLYSIQEAFRKCDTVAELNELRSELENTGVVKKDIGKKKLNNKKEKTAAPSAPLHYIIDGFDVYAGKNNIQNEQLTLKTAAPDDIFFHAKNYHGSHVVIASGSKTVPDNVILAAAVIAANKSKGYMSDKVEVDYCRVKYIKKPKNTPLGTVTYTNNKTILVDATKCPYVPLK